MSTVSVIIPCYNYGRFLPDCLDSVLAQRGVEVEVLIIDDASTDDSAAIAKELAARDGRVELSLHEGNLGHIATYNEGIAWARGDYTMLLSADDMLRPDALSQLTTLLDAHPEAGLAYGRILGWPDGAPLPPAPKLPGSWRIRDGHEYLETRCRAGGNYIGSAGVITHTELQKRLGGYRPQLPHSGDMEMWLRFAAHAAVGYIHTHVAYMRAHSASMSQSRFGRLLDDLEQRRAAFAVLFEEQRAVLPRADQLHAMAKRSMAREALAEACRAVESGRPGEGSVNAFIDFAEATWARATELPEYRRLQLRLRLGPELSARLRPLMVTDLARRARARVRYEYRKRLGG